LANNDKLKCKKNLKLIFEKMLGFKIKPLKIDKKKLHKQELTVIAKRLEGRLYERIFSYFPPMNKEEEELYLQFSCKHLLLDSITKRIAQTEIEIEIPKPPPLRTPAKLTPGKITR